MVNTCNKDKVDFLKNKVKIANSLKNKYNRQYRNSAQRCATLKAKISEIKAENTALKAENKRLQKRLAAGSASSVDTTTAARHRFPLLLVLFCVNCQKYGTMSLRSTRNCVVQMAFIFGLTFKAPSHTSIRNWVCKCGYHRAVMGANLPNAEGCKWGLWVDESIMMGGQKMLLILGRPIDDWAFEEALTIATVYVMSLKLATEWKAKAVCAEIQAVAQGRDIAYIVSDKGTNLVKAYELGGFLHIPDLTHAAAKALERIYNKQETFTAFLTSCGFLRKSWAVSLGKCAYMPPSVRSKVRFANIFPLIAWADQILQLVAVAPETMPDTVLESLTFLEDNRAMLTDLLGLIRAIKSISHLLKNKGFSVENAATVRQILAALPATENTQKFVKELQEWLNTVDNIRQKTGQKTLFCCSDVIESTFGKFKNKINLNSPFGMTEFVFTIANFGADFTKDEICAALEEIKLLTLAKAKPQNKSVARQKRDIFRDIK